MAISTDIVGIDILESASGSDTDGESSVEDSDSNESDSEDENTKAKGVSGLIEIENPNRVHRKAAEKVMKVNLDEKVSGSSSSRGDSAKPELSRRERRELDKQRPQFNDQNRADLARLAIIKQQRAEAAARKDAKNKGKNVVY